MQGKVNKLTGKVNQQRHDNYTAKGKVLQRLAPNFHMQTEKAADADEAAPSPKRRRAPQSPPRHLSVEEDDNSSTDDNQTGVFLGGDMSSASGCEA